MAQLRAYYYNGGDMLELVRYQKECLPKAAGCETINYSCKTVLREERKRRKELYWLICLFIVSHIQG